MRLTNGALVLCALCAPMLAEAQSIAPVTERWVMYHASEQEILSYDALTVRPESEGVYRVWDRWSFSERRITGLKGEPAAARESLIVLDCVNARMLPIAARDFNASGEVLVSVTMDAPEWVYVEPSTLGEGALVKLCAALNMRFARGW